MVPSPVVDEDPRRLRALADALDALAAAKEGIVARVRKGSDPSPADWAALREAEERVAAARRGLQAAERSANVQDVTATQIARRGRAIAKAKAGEDPRRAAIAARWGSQAKAAQAVGISAAALTGYLKGDYQCPRSVAKRFAVDPALPADKSTWPKGVVD